MQDYSDLKELIANFIKKSATEINENTIIDKSVIQGSILIHRMYAEVTELGYKVSDYTNIKTFGQLLSILNSDVYTEKNNSAINTEKFLTDLVDNDSFIGIDIESVQNFKTVDDYREDIFYKQNFSESEISHCLLQADPIQSFAGLFAAKEAIVKVNNIYKTYPFSQIEILFDENGKPGFNGYSISISHVNDLAVAVAVFNNIQSEEKIVSVNEIKESKFWKILALMSFLISLSLVLYLIFFK